MRKTIAAFALFSLTACLPANDPRSEAIRDLTCIIANASLHDADIRTVCKILSEDLWRRFQPALASHRQQTDAARKLGRAEGRDAALNH